MRWLALSWLLLLLAAGPVFGAGEYEVKAAHLPKFASYIQWPSSALPSGTLVIGIVGRDPSGGTIEQALHGASVGGRRVEVRKISATDTTALRECAVLFIGASEEGRAADVLRQVQGRPVLTVGETEDFAVNGGMLQFILVDGQVRFIANPGAAERSGVKMDSNLLRLARRRIGG
jgi:hypothetical protein